MRIIYLIAGAFLWGIPAASQGIQFVEDSSWQQVRAAAKTSDKMIFVDMYTDWCGPCRRMAQEVFVLPAVGTVFNDHFVNYKVNAEKGEGVALKQRYQVASYPTYLFVRSDGTLIYKALGAMTPDRFLAEAEKARAQANEKYTINQLDSLYAYHKTDTAFLYSYIRRRTTLGLDNTDVLDAYFTLLGTKAQRMLRNLQLVVDNGDFLHKSLQVGPAFRALARNKDRFSLLRTDVNSASFAAIKSNVVEKTLRVAIADKNDSLFRALLEVTDKNDIFDNDNVLKLRYLWGTQQYEKYRQAAVAYVDERLMQVSDDTLAEMDRRTYDRVLPSVDSSLAANAKWNNQERADIRYSYKRTQTIQWTNAVVDICRNMVRIAEDTITLKSSLRWVQRCLNLSRQDMRYFKNAYPFYLDVYACLLYRLGERDDAIEWEQKAIDQIKVLAGGKVPAPFESRLSRMKKGEQLHHHEG